MVKTFKQLVERDEDRILIVDALNLGFRWKHQGKEDFRNDYIQTVESFANSYNDWFFNSGFSISLFSLVFIIKIYFLSTFFQTKIFY